MYNAVVRVYHVYVLAYECVAVEVLVCLFHERCPCSEVAPSEVCRTYEYLFSLLHYGVVYRYVIAFGIAAVYCGLFFGCAVYVEHALEHLTYSRAVHSECVDYG